MSGPYAGGVTQWWMLCDVAPRGYSGSRGAWCRSQGLRPSAGAVPMGRPLTVSGVVMQPEPCPEDEGGASHPRRFIPIVFARPLGQGRSSLRSSQVATGRRLTEGRAEYPPLGLGLPMGDLEPASACDRSRCLACSGRASRRDR